MVEYNALVLKHFDAPVNVGELNPDQADVKVLRSGIVENGAVLEFYVQSNVKTKEIMAIKFKAYGDVAVIAACSFATELVLKNKVSIFNDELLTQLQQHMQLPEIKRHVPNLIADTLKKLQE